MFEIIPIFRTNQASHICGFRNLPGGATHGRAQNPDPLLFPHRHHRAAGQCRRRRRRVRKAPRSACAAPASLIGHDMMAQAPGWKEQAEAMNARYPSAHRPKMRFGPTPSCSARPPASARSSAELKAYIDGLGGLWAKGALNGKLGSAFAGSATPHGGNESTIISLYNPDGASGPDHRAHRLCRSPPCSRAPARPMAPAWCPAIRRPARRRKNWMSPASRAAGLRKSPGCLARPSVATVELCHCAPRRELLCCQQRRRMR